MDPNQSVFERAFDLAASGRFKTVSEIRRQLRREGYREELIQGPLWPSNSWAPSRKLGRLSNFRVKPARPRHALRTEVPNAAQS